MKTLLFHALKDTCKGAWFPFSVLFVSLWFQTMKNKQILLCNKEIIMILFVEWDPCSSIFTQRASDTEKTVFAKICTYVPLIDLRISMPHLSMNCCWAFERQWRKEKIDVIFPFGKWTWNLFSSYSCERDPSIFFSCSHFRALAIYLCKVPDSTFPFSCPWKPWSLSSATLSWNLRETKKKRNSWNLPNHPSKQPRGPICRRRSPTRPGWKHISGASGCRCTVHVWSRSTARQPGVF